jgi:hypothetical protein
MLMSRRSPTVAARQTFTIGVTRLAIIYQEFEVEAADPEKAASKALQEAKAAGAGGWDVDDVFDDGKPNCAISVSSCRDEDGNDCSVDMSIAP